MRDSRSSRARLPWTLDRHNGNKKHLKKTLEIHATKIDSPSAAAGSRSCRDYWRGRERICKLTADKSSVRARPILKHTTMRYTHIQDDRNLKICSEQNFSCQKNSNLKKNNNKKTQFSKTTLLS